MSIDSRISGWRLFGLWKPESEHFHVYSLHLSVHLSLLLVWCCIQTLGPSNSCFAGRLWPWGIFCVCVCSPEAVNTSRARVVYLLWLRSQQLKPRDTERGSDNPISLEHLSVWLRFLVSRSSPRGTKIEMRNLDCLCILRRRMTDSKITAVNRADGDSVLQRPPDVIALVYNSSKCFPLWTWSFFLLKCI